MSDEALRVEFRVDLGKRHPAPKPAPATKADRQRTDRAARRARNLALAYWIEYLIQTGQVADLAAVAKSCGVSRPRISKVASLMGLAGVIQDKILAAPQTDTGHNALSDHVLSQQPQVGSPADCLHAGRTSRYTSNTTRLGP